MLPTIITIGVIMTIAFLVVRVLKGGLPGMFLKAAASALFIGTACAAFSYKRDNFEYGIMMILGFIFSLLGDIWLDLKFVYKDDETVFTYAGFISFMIGHSFFIPAIFYGYSNFNWKYVIYTVVIGLIVIALSLAFEKIMKMDYGKYKVITALYSFVVSGTMFAAIFGMISGGFTKKYIVLTVGATSFFLSDLVLSGIYFKKGGNTKFMVIVNHVLYYLAQFALASTLLMD